MVRWPRPDFPKTLRAFRRRFAEPQACLEYLWASRWPDGFKCPRCGHDQAWQLKTRPLYQCQDCGHQLSPIAGTVLHRSHFPVQDWFWAAYLLSTHTPGLSARQLQRQMSCSYKTAWFLLHRLRRAMVRPERTTLSGRVEVDEAFIGGPAKGKHARGRHAERTGRLRLCKTLRADERTIRSFLVANVEAGALIATDGWRGYSQTALAGYVHHPSLHLAVHIHRPFSNLKTWLGGPIMGSNQNIFRGISMSSSFATIAGRRRWPHSNRCWASPARSRRTPRQNSPCLSQRDKHVRLKTLYLAR